MRRYLLFAYCISLPLFAQTEVDLLIQCKGDMCQLPEKQLDFLINHNNKVTEKLIDAEKELAKLRKSCNPQKT